MKNVVIIGAGPAGLTAAYELLTKTDIKPIILEASNDIGGISKTINYNGNRIDIGGHRFFTKVDEVNKLWETFMPIQGQLSIDDKLLNRKIELNINGPDPEKEDNVLLKRNRISRIYYLKKFFDYPISLKFATFRNMGLGRTFKGGFSYLKSCFVKKDESNLENFYINRFGKALYSMFFEKYTAKVWGRSPSEIDASWGKQRVKGLSLGKTLLTAVTKPFKKNKKNVETSLIGEFVYPKHGPGSLYEEMARVCVEKGATLRKLSEVTKINVKNNHITSVVINNQETIDVDILISSMPLKDLANAIGKDNMPKDIYDIANGLVYRDFMTVGLLLKDLKIKNKTKIKTLNNRIPDTWIYVQEGEVQLGRIQIFNNWSPYLVKDNTNNVWIGLEYFVNEGDKNWTSNDKDFINMAIDETAQIGIINKEDVIDSCVYRIKKAYPAYFDTYKDLNKLVTYLNNIDNLYCIGRNGQHRYNNMDHSMLTAIEAVKSIVDPINNPKEKIWNVNTEQEYSETKVTNKK